MNQLRTIHYVQKFAIRGVFTRSRAKVVKRKVKLYVRITCEITAGRYRVKYLTIGRFNRNAKWKTAVPQQHCIVNLLQAIILS